MKQNRLRQSLVYLFVALVVFTFVSVSWADGVAVEVPYAVTNTQWWTGVAIKNLDASSATATLEMEFFSKSGNLLGAVEIDPLEPQEIFSEVTTTIYSALLPTNYSIKVSHSGNEELAVTVFVGNSATGGFSYQSYNSRAYCQATASIPTWDQILPAAERFELVLGNEAVLDHETGLVWQRDTDAKRDWNDAHTYCYQLVIGGRGGWRLPTIDELVTLVDYTATNDPRLPAGHPFTNVMSAYYWSSTTYAADTTIAWYVDFNYGLVKASNNLNSYYVRAVRSGQ